MTPDITEAVDLVDDWINEGMPPILGGVLQQTVSFMETLRLVRSERVRIQLARNKRT